MKNEDSLSSKKTNEKQPPGILCIFFKITKRNRAMYWHAVGNQRKLLTKEQKLE